MLKLANVEVKYVGVILVLRGISLDVEAGNIVTILGANGAGKSTTLKAISGLLHTEEGRVTDGSIEFNNVRIDGFSPEKIARMGIIQILEGRRVLEHLTVEENLIAGAAVVASRRQIKKDLDMIYGYFPRLKELRRHTSGYVSGGEQQMTVTGRALIAHPKLMLLDEPSLGLAPLIVKEILDIIKRINIDEKTSMLLVEQNARAALSLADFGYVMENGRIVLDGPGDKLRENEDVKEFYLGLSAVGKRKSYKEVKHYKRRKRWL